MALVDHVDLDSDHNGSFEECGTSAALRSCGTPRSRLCARRTLSSVAPADVESPVFALAEQRRGVDAREKLIDGEFTLLEGSSVVGSWDGVGKAESTRRAYANYRAQHEQLIAEGALVVEDGRARVARDIRFGSPSTAGAVSLGRSCNGRREWVDSTGASYGQWENREVEATA